MLTNVPGEHNDATIKLTAAPVKARDAAPTPDATTEMTVMFEEAFHFTSAMKKGGSRDEVSLLV